MKTAFITGATGFVGSHTAELFLHNGWHVKALVRNSLKPGRLPAGVEAVDGDISDAIRYRASLGGCDAVVHVAGTVKARTLAEYRIANASGAQAIARAANELCPEAMFVHVSSQAAAGPARDGRPITELDPPRPVSWYGQSKLEGELRVREAFTGALCIIRPSVVHGRGDPGMLELFRTVEKGFAPIVAGGRAHVQLIDVTDLARVLVAAAERRDLAGRTGFAAGEAASMRDLIQYIASLRSRPPWTVPIPGWILRVAGSWESLRQWITRQARPFNRDKAREMLQKDWLCDPAPLLGSLQISDLRPWQQGIYETCRCYVEDAWLRRALWTV